jgi:NAD(P)-dependent dehydrogenase (short-subunit alcohol dehydrogenase family)
LAFAREGAKVVVADVVTEGSQRTAQLIKETKGEALFVKTDVTKSVNFQGNDPPRGALAKNMSS